LPEDLQEKQENNGVKKRLLVVSDSSVIIALAMSCHLDLMGKLFEKVIVPEAVWKEVTVEADLLPALKIEASLQGLTGSPHLFGFTFVICGAVGVARDPPISIKAFFSMFRTATTSLSASNPHAEHFILL